jgi:hypothetical protein
VPRSISLIIVGRAALAAVAVAALATAACSDKVLQGKGSSYLVIDELAAGQGGSASTTFSTLLQSDVLTNGGVFEDSGRVTLHIAMKDVVGNPYTPSVGTEPTANNFITVNRYHVDFVRSDGRNVQGVDVPYSVDGAVTGTITTSQTQLVFPLVPVQRKLEAPLRALRNGGGAVAIMTVASVTFYGFDQTGNAVAVTGLISVNFADWADEDSQ